MPQDDRWAMEPDAGELRADVTALVIEFMANGAVADEHLTDVGEVDRFAEGIFELAEEPLLVPFARALESIQHAGGVLRHVLVGMGAKAIGPIDRQFREPDLLCLESVEQGLGAFRAFDQM